LQLNEKIKENEQLRTTLAHMEIELNKLKGIEHELILVKEISDVRFADVYIKFMKFEKYKT
jgi:transcriptional regulator NrdR family protein